MARTRTAGIRIDSDGRRIIDKEHRGVGIYLRLGPISQEDVEQQLTSEVDRLDAELRYNANHHHRFVDCAERYFAESKHRRSVDVAVWHVRLLTPYIGMLEIHQIHDATLKLFVHDRLASGVKASTVNRSLEVVRTILHRAARSYRDGEGRPWLDAVLPLITRLPESPRPPVGGEFAV